MHTVVDHCYTPHAGAPSTLQGTGTLAGTKARPMNRTDFFTKLPGDVNQVPDDQL
jgi:hypothetical protein